MTQRVLALVALAGLSISTARAQTIVETWASVTPPPPPALAAVTVEPATTALLLLDFNGHDTASSGPCNTATKPRCRTTVPKVRALLERARAKGLLIVYSLSSSGVRSDIQPELAPSPSDRIVAAGPDKFIGTDLRAILADRGITTAIVTGTASEGAVLDTATDAALHGMAIVVPVDTMSSTEPYAEQYVAWHLTHAPGVSQKTTLTRSDMIAF